MRIGISRPPPPPYPIPDVDGALLAQRAEALGFESIFYGEHPIKPLDQPGKSVHAAGVPLFQDTLVMLARASALTTTLKLGSGVFLVPEHNPVRFAKELASLDLYSGGGRLLLGIGVGWSQTEIEVLGGSFDKRWERTAEAVSLMKKLWTEERVEHRGTYFQLPALQCFPQPATKPHPPILIGARGRRAIERVIEYGDGWLPAFVTPDDIENGPSEVRRVRQTLSELATAAGRDPQALEISPIIRGGTKIRDSAERFHEAGADRIVISMPIIQSADDGYAALERIAELVL